MSNLVDYAKDDLISKEEILKAFSDYVGSGMSMNDFDALWDIVAKMPPVQPNKRIGKWIEDGHNLSDNWIFTGWKCSVCGKHALQDRYDRYLRSDYCPNCGAKMVEPQESEEV